jgi:hypothetical protein
MKPHRPKHSRTRRKAAEHGYRSGYELAIAQDLTERGVAFGYEQTSFSYIKPVRNGRCGKCASSEVGKRCKYTVDFDLPGGVYVEAKGRFAGADRAKLKCVISQHSGTDLRLLFQSDNWTTKQQTQRYSEWATKQGFQWAVGKVIPEEWTS